MSLVRIVKRKMLIPPDSSKPAKQSKTAQHKYICVSKDADEDADEDADADECMDMEGDDGDESSENTGDTFDDLYDSVHLYNDDEEYYGFPRLIHGVVYYVDTSNFVFDFRTKELLGKYQSERNAILFWQDVTKKQKQEKDDGEEEEEIKVIF
jgi:hypothetical protein